MSTTLENPAKTSRWMDWQPKVRVLADSVEGEPTKPSKPGSVGFEGAMPGDSPNIEVLPQRANAAEERQRGESWAAWKAAALNRLFQEQGITA